MSAPAMTMDALTHALSNERRRQVVRVLNQTGELPLKDLCEHVASRETDTDVGDAPRDDRQNCYIALYQNHLDKLNDAGIVEWNSSSRDPVTPGQNHAVAYRALGDITSQLTAVNRRRRLRARLVDYLPTFDAPTDTEIATDGGDRA